MAKWCVSRNWADGPGRRPEASGSSAFSGLRLGERKAVERGAINSFKRFLGSGSAGRGPSLSTGMWLDCKDGSCTCSCF